MSRVNPETGARIARMRKAGHTLKAISIEFDLPLGTVSYWSKPRTNTRRKVTPDIAQRIVSLREEGWKLDAIAAEVGLKQSTVNWWCTREGAISARTRRIQTVGRDYVRNGRVVRAFTPEEDARLQQLSIQGLRISEIARALGRGTNSVQGRLNALALYDALREGGA
ncbi:hypothetical protein [Asticcacaulis sp. YBE204]|uniref:hypothetical protein n=1 Tax=Asticcacaulis sp. YBE204 TaxID=1282363 RepID=UPI0003C40194|nr:hypothetical protein [Asticcacaulis sp. YBE204]ESQ78476.1 hypothetical protein AEYBE204_13050 [Asticcacaulis sp. YBE204]